MRRKAQARFPGIKQGGTEIQQQGLGFHVSCSLLLISYAEKSSFVFLNETF
jgi:hypothetical protein